MWDIWLYNNLNQERLDWCRNLLEEPSQRGLLMDGMMFSQVVLLTFLLKTPICFSNNQVFVIWMLMWMDELIWVATIHFGCHVEYLRLSHCLFQVYQSLPNQSMITLSPPRLAPISTPTFHPICNDSTVRVRLRKNRMVGILPEVVDG